MTINVDLYNLLRTKFNLSETDAKEAAQIFEQSFKEIQKENVTKDYLRAELKEQKSEILKGIYVANIIEFVALIASILGILTYMHYNP